VTQQHQGVLRIVRLAALTAFAKAPGFLIPIIIAAFFGAGHLTDAYFLAYGGVLLVGGTVGQPLEAAIVPFAAHALALGRGAANKFIEMLFRRGLLVGIVSALLGAVLIGAGLHVSPPEGISSGVVFTFYLLLAPAAVAWCVAGLYTGSLVSGWHLEVGAMGYGFRGVGALAGALTGAAVHELWPVAIGVSAGEWARVWWLRSRWRRALGDIKEGSSGAPERGFASAAAHQMAAQGMMAGAQFLERFLVGTVAVAAISHIEYATRLIMVAAVVFDGGIAPWLLVRWSNARVRTALPSNWISVYQPIALGALAALLISCALIGTAPLIVSGLLQHGAFTAEDGVAVAQLLRWYAVWYFVNMCTLCVDRLLLARAQNRLLAGLAAVRASVRIGAILVLLSRLGMFALPAGAIVADVVYLAALLVVSRQEAVFTSPVVQP